MTRTSSLERLARLSATGIGSDAVVSESLALIKRATSASAVFVIYGRNEEFDFYGTDEQLELSRNALWFINRELTDRGAPVSFSLRHGRVMDFNDVDAAPDYGYLATLLPARRTSSQMLIVRRDTRRFSANTSAFLVAAGPALALLLEQRLNLAVAEREQENFRALASISEVMSGAEDVEQLLTRFARAIASLARVDYVTIDLVDGSGEVELRCVNYDVAARDRWRGAARRDDPVRREAIRFHKAVWFADAQQDERLSDRARNFFTRSLIRSTAVIPLYTGEESVGVLSVAALRPMPWDAQQRAMFDALAAQVATAVKVSQLYADRQRSEERFKLISASVPLAIFEASADGRCRYINERWCEITGMSVADSLNHGWIEATHPDDVELVASALQASIETQSEYSLEYRIRRPSGEVRWVHSRASIVFTDGTPTGYVGSVEDVTDRHLSEEALRRSEGNFRLLFAANPSPTWVFERQTRRFLEVNEAAVQHYGYTRDEFLAMTIDAIRPAEDVVLLNTKVDWRGQSHLGEWRHLLRDGTVIDVYVRAHALEFDGRDAVLSVCDDITERIRAEESRARLSAIIEATTDLVSITDPQGKPVYMNAAGRRLLALPDTEEISQSTITDDRPSWAKRMMEEEALPTARERGVWSGETAYLTREGREIPVSQLILAHFDGAGAVKHYSTIARDMTERKQFESRLLHLASHDGLTSLFNRRRFEEELEIVLAGPKSTGGLVLLDVDQFKDTNDSRGHMAGDELLTSLAELLRSTVRGSDIVARFGGDEFVILLNGAPLEQCARIADALLDRIRQQTFLVAGSPLQITASVGLAVFPQHGTTAGELLSRADYAMYRAKEQGRNRAVVFEEGADWQGQIESRLGWYSRIREALDRNLFVLQAQPIRHLRTNRTTQYELLLRMVGPDRELILPGAFLDVGERSGLIQAIDRWVVRRAIQTLGEHQAQGGDLILEVNLSGKAFGDNELPDIIRDELSVASVDPRRLVLEVTETTAIANIHQAQRFIETLKAIGCKFALDDFGVGFSSFYHLKHLPVDYLKIDGSFIRDLAQSKVDQSLVRAIVSLARGLNKKTIAEYVNDEETLRLLRKFGVGYAQGFLIGKPASLPRFQSDEYLAA